MNVAQVARSVGEVLAEHVTLELESIDRMYLNLYVPMLQTEGGITHFWREHRGYKFASSALMAPMTDTFVAAIEAFAADEGVELITFSKKQRKEDIAKKYLADFQGEEGVLFIGKAQEKATVVRTTRRRNERTGESYAWLMKSTAMVNQYYFYCVDRDFGPFFLKFCSYFPYNGKLCLNGHEYVKRQLAQQGIAFEALDNGIASCEDPKLAQDIADELSSEKIDALAHKWLQRLPHPFTAADSQAGFVYNLSILQAEFSLTQVLDRPLSGRIFFEQVIRDNLDLGRPDQVQLIFDRRVSRRTPGRFRTRILTEGVVPTLHVDYKTSRIKQYYKEGRALRTETTINNTYDFQIGRLLLCHSTSRSRTSDTHGPTSGRGWTDVGLWRKYLVFKEILEPDFGPGAPSSFRTLAPHVRFAHARPLQPCVRASGRRPPCVGLLLLSRLRVLQGPVQEEARLAVPAGRRLRCGDMRRRCLLQGRRRRVPVGHAATAGIRQRSSIAGAS